MGDAIQEWSGRRMKTIFMTVGLPASGKTTWAKSKLTERPGAYKRVNKDLLREMLDCGKWSSENEKFLLGVRDYVVTSALNAGKHVIVDDTNLAPKHQATLREIAKKHGAAFELVDFTNVSVDECVERDGKRANYVGEKVIRDMHAQFLAKPSVKPVIDPALPWCVIVDIDGTTAIMNGRGPFDWHSVHTDLPNEPVCHLVRSIQDKVIYLSGRDEVCRTSTEKWLFDHGLIDRADLYMRPAGDQRDDRIVKEEIYRHEIKGKYNVRYVIDDRDKVVRLWRSLGLTCLQVAEGNF
jgi:predicted kinase